MTTGRHHAAIRSAIILGPKDANAEARKVWRQTGLWFLILDVNDKGAVDVLGLQPAANTPARTVDRTTTSNPFGNDDQKTPR